MNNVLDTQLNDQHKLACCLTFGFFDGVHLGHRSVIDKTVELAGKNLKPLAVIHDNETYINEYETFLTTQEEKHFLLRDSPINIISSDVDFNILSPCEYVEKLLLEDLNAKIIVAGEGFSFGRNGEVDLSFLQHLSDKYNFELYICPLVKQNNQPISKNVICKAYDQGHTEDAETMLGHRYIIISEVYHGKAQGRKIGFPTINQMPPKGKYLPKLGVYASTTEVKGVEYNSMTNIGRRPSLDNLDFINFETYILNFSADLYGERIAVQPTHYVRDVINFKSRDDVMHQIGKDIESVQGYFSDI